MGNGFAFPPSLAEKNSDHDLEEERADQVQHDIAGGTGARRYKGLVKLVKAGGDKHYGHGQSAPARRPAPRSRHRSAPSQKSQPAQDAVNREMRGLADEEME